MNKGKLKVAKQKMARVNINILRINGIKWTRKGKFNSDTIISTTVSNNPLEEME